ncbi:MAG: gephyrin-like molybdotransferase Glp [Pseudomonadota bacterium]
MVNPLMPLEEARKRLLEHARAVTAGETVSLASSYGRVLASDLFAELDVPHWDNSAMDGYAARLDSTSTKLQVSQTIRAGVAPLPLAPDSVARIFTGAPIPQGANVVIAQEEVAVMDDGRIELPKAAQLGQHIRRRGEDISRGDLLLAAGTRLKPADLGVLASQGYGEISVRSPLRVALLASGDELVDPGSRELKVGEIYNSNSIMLESLLRAWGCSLERVAVVRDDFATTYQALKSAAESADLVISSGGASVGDADVIKQALSELGELALWRVAIKPGKPFVFGQACGTPFIGLPGNPSSAFVTLAILARPFISVLQGRSDGELHSVPVLADFSLARPANRTEFLRVNLTVKDKELLAQPLTNQSSGILSALSQADALAIVEQGSPVQAGAALQAITLNQLLW